MDGFVASVPSRGRRTEMQLTKERPAALEQTQMAWEALVALLPSVASHEGPNIRCGGVEPRTVSYLCELAQAFVMEFVAYNWGNETFLDEDMSGV